MVHRESVGDDGSHRLLWLPCVVVVLVMVMMVTACSPADGEAGDGVDVAAAEHSGDGAGEGEAALDGMIAEPEVTDDGRMIQPAGHTGLWFETRPLDPMDNLVYKSQRFVGQPVVLELLGERAMMPQWEDMPEPCHPEIDNRIGQIGLDVDVSPDDGLGIAFCGLVAADSINSGIRTFDIGFVEDYRAFSKIDQDDLDPLHGYLRLGAGSEELAVGCIAVDQVAVGRYSAFSGSADSAANVECQRSASVLQLFKNILGGGFYV